MVTGYTFGILPLVVSNELLMHVHSYSFCVADEFLLLESVNISLEMFLSLLTLHLGK